MKRYIILILLLCGNLGWTQDNLERYQPVFYNEDKINNAFEEYRLKAKDLKEYLPKNHVKDGTVDYTLYLQKGLNENRITLMPDFPILINDNGLKVKSNSVVLFNKNSRLKLLPSKKDTYNMIEIHQVENVEIFFPKIHGDILTHKGKTGEWGMGIGIRSSKNVQIYNPEITDCWGDGVYVGVIRDNITKKIHNESENIGVYNGYFNNNSRNGISIVGVKNMKVYNNLIANTKRTFPKSGIDIEPGPKLTQNVVLKDNVTYKNGARGVDIFLRTIAKNKQNTTTVEIINHKDIGSPIGIRVAEYKDDEKMNKIQGSVKIISPILTKNRMKGIYIEKNQQFAPTIIIKGLKGIKNDILQDVKYNNQIKILN